MSCVRGGVFFPPGVGGGGDDGPPPTLVAAKQRIKGIDLMGDLDSVYDKEARMSQYANGLVGYMIQVKRKTSGSEDGFNDSEHLNAIVTNYRNLVDVFKQWKHVYDHVRTIFTLVENVEYVQAVRKYYGEHFLVRLKDYRNPPWEENEDLMDPRIFNVELSSAAVAARTLKTEHEEHEQFLNDVADERVKTIAAFFESRPNYIEQQEKTNVPTMTENNTLNESAVVAKMKQLVEAEKIKLLGLPMTTAGEIITCYNKIVFRFTIIGNQFKKINAQLLRFSSGAAKGNEVEIRKAFEAISEIDFSSVEIGVALGTIYERVVKTDTASASKTYQDRFDEQRMFIDTYQSLLESSATKLGVFLSEYARKQVLLYTHPEDLDEIRSAEETLAGVRDKYEESYKDYADWSKFEDKFAELDGERKSEAGTRDVSGEDTLFYDKVIGEIKPLYDALKFNHDNRPIDTIQHTIDVLYTIRDKIKDEIERADKLTPADKLDTQEKIGDRLIELATISESILTECQDPALQLRQSIEEAMAARVMGSGDLIEGSLKEIEGPLGNIRGAFDPLVENIANDVIDRAKKALSEMIRKRGEIETMGDRLLFKNQIRAALKDIETRYREETERIDLELDRIESTLNSLTTGDPSTVDESILNAIDAQQTSLNKLDLEVYTEFREEHEALLSDESRENDFVGQKIEDLNGVEERIQTRKTKILGDIATIREDVKSAIGSAPGPARKPVAATGGASISEFFEKDLDFSDTKLLDLLVRMGYRVTDGKIEGFDDETYNRVLITLVKEAIETQLTHARDEFMKNASDGSRQAAVFEIESRGINSPEVDRILLKTPLMWVCMVAEGGQYYVEISIIDQVSQSSEDQEFTFDGKRRYTPPRYAEQRELYLEYARVTDMATLTAGKRQVSIISALDEEYSVIKEGFVKGIDHGKLNPLSDRLRESMFFFNFVMAEFYMTGVDNGGSVEWKACYDEIFYKTPVGAVETQIFWLDDRYNQIRSKKKAHKSAKKKDEKEAARVAYLREVDKAQTRFTETLDVLSRMSGRFRTQTTYAGYDATTDFYVSNTFNADVGGNPRVPNFRTIARCFLFGASVFELVMKDGSMDELKIQSTWFNAKPKKASSYQDLFGMPSMLEKGLTTKRFNKNKPTKYPLAEKFRMATKDATAIDKGFDEKTEKSKFYIPDADDCHKGFIRDWLTPRFLASPDFTTFYSRQPGLIVLDAITIVGKYAAHRGFAKDLFGVNGLGEMDGATNLCQFISGDTMYLWTMAHSNLYDWLFGTGRSIVLATQVRSIRLEVAEKLYKKDNPAIFFLWEHLMKSMTQPIEAGKIETALLFANALFAVHLLSEEMGAKAHVIDSICPAFGSFNRMKETNRYNKGEVPNVYNYWIKPSGVEYNNPNPSTLVGDSVDALQTSAPMRGCD